MTPLNRIILGGRGRSSKTESDRSLFESVRDYCFELLRIRIWVYLYDPEIVDVGLEVIRCTSFVSMFLTKKTAAAEPTAARARLRRGG